MKNNVLKVEEVNGWTKCIFGGYEHFLGDLDIIELFREI
jgi:hypothetical protein